MSSSSNTLSATCFSEGARVGGNSSPTGVYTTAAVAARFRRDSIPPKGGSLGAVATAKLPADAMAVTGKWFNWTGLTLVIIGPIAYLAPAYQDDRRATGKGPSRSRALKLLTGEC